jgi:hypothetical protein
MGMKKDALREFIRSVVAEVVPNNPRVASQLIDTDADSEEDDKKDKENSSDVKEYSGVGGIMGGMMPAGRVSKKSNVSRWS